MSLFQRVRGRLSKDPTGQSDPHEFCLPTKYSISSATSPHTPIPNPLALRNAFVPDPTTEAPNNVLIYPDASHVAVHLCLLECFRKLRASAVELDIQSFKPPAYAEDASGPSDLVEERLPESLHWDLLVRLAVTRFTTWWNNLPQVFSHAVAYDHRAGANCQLSSNYLPPLDVLLIWYSLMLDEQEYSRVCNEAADTRLSLLCFPWPAIRDAIDRESMTFCLTKPATILFQTISEQSADVFEYVLQSPAYAESERSPFAIDLVSQVHHQEAFIEASHDALWIRSPAMSGSIYRACLDYLQVDDMGRLGDFTSQRLPYGVELVWRTHRLFPAQYLNYRHNNSDAREEAYDLKATYSSDSTTSTRSSRQLGDDERCICWTCERIRDDAPSWKYDKRIKFYDPLVLEALSSDQVSQIKDDIGFHRATEANRRAGIPLPTRPPTAAEKEAEKAEAKRKKEMGHLCGPNEFIEVRPNGKKKYKIKASMRLAYGYGI